MRERERYWPFFSLIMILLVLICVTLAWSQFQHNSNQQYQLALSRFAIIKSYAQNALETGDYDSIQPLFDAWIKLQPSAEFLQLRAANGFIHAEYLRADKSPHTITINDTLNYGYDSTAFLRYRQDVSEARRRLLETTLILAAGLLVVFLSGVVIIRRSRRITRLSQVIRRRNQDLNAEQTLLQSVIDQLPDLIYFKSIDGQFRGCNRAFKRFFGIKQNSIAGSTDFDLFDQKQAEFANSRDLAIIRSGHPIKGESWITGVDQIKKLMDSLYTPYHDDRDNLLGLIGISRDITQLRRTQENLESLAYHDPLTGLANRLYLIDRMQKDMATSKRRAIKMAVCAIDLDGFKQVNDDMGHEIGDRVLVMLASRIKAVVRTEDTVARWGGDEFTLLLTDVENEQDDIHYLLERIQNAINAPIRINDEVKVEITSSIGITLYPDDDNDADTLLRHADQAMYLSKQAGKNRYSFFDQEHDRSVHSAAQKLANLMQAIENAELRLYYQPQISLDTGCLHGFEALVRWQHPQRGILAPASFLPPAENLSANISLDNWVLEQAVRQLHAWCDQYPDHRISINLSAASLQDPLFPSRLGELLERFSGCAGRLEFEILESTSFADWEKVSTVISQCMDQGVHFALDDFGTGYSSLTYLRRLPAKTLKIDRSFVIDMLDNKDDLNIVDGIIRLGRVFDKQVVAEGVESIAHGIELKMLGAHILQGYAIAKPMPVEELLQWQAEYHCPSDWLDDADAPLNGQPVLAQG